MSTKIIALIFIFILQISILSCQKKNYPKPIKTHEYTNLTSSDRSGKLMAENEFWDLIDQSRKISKDDYEVQISSLKSLLMTMESDKIQKFDNTFTALMAGSYNWKLWGASYVINGGCSDDCFEYFRQYLIAHGREKFYETLENPDDCAYWIKSESEELWEGIQYSAYDAYRKKTGKEMSRNYEPDYTLKGEKFDESNVENQYPKLADKF